MSVRALRRPSLVLTVVGLVWSALMVLQPWASCPEEDSAAGCPVVGTQAVVQVVAFSVLAVGLCGLVVGRARSKPSAPTSDPP